MSEVGISSVVERTADAVRASAPFREIREHALLRGVVVGDREGLGLLKADVTGTVGFQDRRAETAKLETLGNHGLGDAEPGGNVGHGRAVIDKGAECLEGIGGMHGSPHGILGEAELRMRRCHPCASWQATGWSLAMAPSMASDVMARYRRWPATTSYLPRLPLRTISDCKSPWALIEAGKFPDTVGYARLAHVALPWRRAG